MIFKRGLPTRTVERGYWERHKEATRLIRFPKAEPLPDPTPEELLLRAINLAAYQLAEAEKLYQQLLSTPS